MTQCYPGLVTLVHGALLAEESAMLACYIEIKVNCQQPIYTNWMEHRNTYNVGLILKTLISFNSRFPSTQTHVDIQNLIR